MWACARKGEADKVYICVCDVAVLCDHVGMSAKRKMTNASGAKRSVCGFARLIRYTYNFYLRLCVVAVLCDHVGLRAKRRS